MKLDIGQVEQDDNHAVVQHIDMDQTTAEFILCVKGVLGEKVKNVYAVSDHVGSALTLTTSQDLMVNMQNYIVQGLSQDACNGEDITGYILELFNYAAS